MHLRCAVFLTLLFGLMGSAYAQEEKTEEPIELEVLKAAVGVWDAKIEVWPEGPDSDPITFSGVETNRAFGKHWIASDFDSEFMNQTMSIHSIVGYDLDEKRLVGKVIDEGPYAALMTGDYDKESATVHWVTKAKMPDGTPMVQKTSITQKSEDERVLVLSMPGEKEGEFVKFMQIIFTKRK